MNLKTKYRIGLAILALTLLLPNVLQAQGNITLEGVAQSLGRLTQRFSELEERIRVIEQALDIPPTPTPTPKPTSTPTSISTPTSAPAPYLTVNRDRVNVRQGPGTNSPVIGTAARGQKFDIEGRNHQGDWYLFCCVDGELGWIHTSIIVVEHADSIPVVTPAPTPTPTRTPRPPRPTAIPATSVPVCDYEGFEFINADDVSYARVTRLVARFTMGDRCDADDAVAFALVHSALMIEENNTIDAIGYHFYCNAADVNAGSNISVDFAPFGDWSEAGETRKGDYSTHAAILQFARDVPCR